MPNPLNSFVNFGNTQQSITNTQGSQNNIFTPENREKFSNMYNMMKNSNNPEQVIRMIAERDPRAKFILNMCQGGSIDKLIEYGCSQLGISPQQVVNFITGK